MERAGTAVLKFERGEMQLALFRHREGLVWFHGREPVGPPLATAAAAVQFLRDLCELYNSALVLAQHRASEWKPKGR